MPQVEQHIPDEDLLQSADGELSPRKIAQIQKHLKDCWTCRARSRELEETIAAFVATCHEPLPSDDGGRARLKWRMHQLSNASPAVRSWNPFLATLTPWRMKLAGAVGLCIGIAAMLLYLGAAVIKMNETVVEARAIPDRTLTPGATLPVTREDVCSAGIPSQAAMISEPVARQVFAAYGISHPSPRAYELDYLITPALGGDNDIRNFWPQPYRSTIWNAHYKDALEDHLHRLVCEGNLELATAQHDISHDWIQAYRKYFRTRQPLAEHAAYEKDPPWE